MTARGLATATCALAALLVFSAGCRPTSQGAPPRDSATCAELAELAEPTERPTPPPRDAVRLVLWITVDQLRGDFLATFSHHLDPGGFERLLRQGGYYPNAHYRHAITETAPGHATLFTGAPPSEHGIVGNAWLHRDTGAEILSVWDPASTLVGAGLPAELPPAAGRSPRSLLLPTIGDALAAATQGGAKVFSVSTKDRAAILPGGSSGKAFWLGPAGFITSRYYYDALPAWARAQNTERPLSAYHGALWSLLHPPERYRRLLADDRPEERPLFDLGRTFPHRVHGQGAALAGAVAVTPFADELTVDFALRLMAEEALGADGVTDLLAVSLSSTDTVGHAFGPESLEAEDNFARLDRQLARLLGEVDARVGLNRTLVVLSADHGGSETAEHASALGLSGARIEPDALVATAREAAQQHFGTPDLVLGFVTPALWINRQLALHRELDPARVVAVVAEAVQSRDDVYAAWPTASLLEDRDAPDSRAAGARPGSLLAQARLSVHPLRSGDVYVVPRPHSLLLQNAEIAATHGSPWRYDTHVPLIVSGPGIRSGVYERTVAPDQLAATVALLLGMTPPAGATPAPLTELFGDRTPER